MATNAAAVLPVPRPRPVPNPADLPQSFQEALKAGWVIAREESALDIRGHQRKGAVLLKLKGSPMRLRIPYVATKKEWQFGKPEAIE